MHIYNPSSRLLVVSSEVAQLVVPECPRVGGQHGRQERSAAAASDGELAADGDSAPAAAGTRCRRHLLSGSHAGLFHYIYQAAFRPFRP